jgi:S-DNA-T family DNA segregation ATPase FtsK/SpoIIIE
VFAGDDEPLRAVLDQLGRILGTPATCLFSGTGRLHGDLLLRDERLRHGAVLGIDRPAADAQASARTGALDVRIVGGPDAGRILPLDKGSHLVGRSQDCGVRLGDPDVSRHHVGIDVGAGTVEVADLGSSNGTRLDGHEVTRRTPWTVGTRLQVGATTLELGIPDGLPTIAGSSVGGRAVLRRAVRISEGRRPVEVAFPQPPATPSARRLAWIAVALPAVAGISLAVVLSAPSFLFFALLSPLVAVATWWSDRRSGRRAHRRDLAEFRRRTAAAEAELAGAVRADVRASQRRFPDLAVLASAARRRTSLLWSRSADDADLLTVRIGTGPGTTGVVRREPDGLRAAAPADDLPVDVDLRSGGLAVVGPRDPALGVLRSVIAQLAALHPPDTVELVLVTSAVRLHDWRWLRWLPHLRSTAGSVPAGAATDDDSEDAASRSLVALVERRRAVARSAAGQPWSGPWAAVIVDGPLPGFVAALLAGAADVGVVVLSHGPTLGQIPVPVGAALRLTGDLGTQAALQIRGAPLRDVVAVDRCPLDVARTVARDLAGVTRPAGRSTLPTEVSFHEVMPPDLPPADSGTRDGWSRDRGSLEVALGVGTGGVERLDLCRHGPHALVAGTTGAGKSELLQTLIAGLALAHPPDRCSFLLIDYKGGAAFAEAAALPHTVGLLTDLDDVTTARALRSLTAELARREALLAEHAVADISDLGERVPLARLVIVVDEFATLAEELPAFVPGLVGIAQRGRSLGIHLVLATQRPAGAVSADIRANCTLRICLRTTDEADSRDVLGEPEAAHLPLDVPGRAYLRTGNGAARILQVARVSHTGRADGDAPVVSPWCWPVPPVRPAPPHRGESQLGRLVRRLDDRARALSLSPPHRPWRPPLPTRLSPSDADELTGTAGRSPMQLLLGLVDRPDRQEQHPLVLDLADGGGWLAVGGPRSGRTTLLRNVLRQSTAGGDVDRLHVHVVDLGGGALAAEAAVLPSVGTAIGGDDALRTVRLVHRLAEEVAHRRSARSVDRPHILLLVDGVEELGGLLDDADPARGSGELLRLVRDGGAAGVTCVLTASRAVPGGRLAGAVRQRLVLPLPDRADYAVAGVPLTAVPSRRPPGRALVGEDAAECQLVLPPPLDPARHTRRSRPGRHATPLRIAELPPDPLVDGAMDQEARSFLRIVLGPGGDDGAPLTVDLLRTGGLLLVGPPGSGRSSALEAVVGDLLANGVPVLRLGGAPFRAIGQVGGGDVADLDDLGATTNWLERRHRGPAVVCVDDLGPAGSAPSLGELPQLGGSSGVVLMATASAADLSTWFQGPISSLRRARSGVLLCPGPGDADVLGLRLPRTPVPSRPGSGWLVRPGGLERVQLARHRVRPPVAQSSSSTGPISCVAYQASS